MFLRFFKNNNPSIFILLPSFAIVFWLVCFFNVPVFYDKHSTLLYQLSVNRGFSLPFLSSFFAFLLVIVQAFIINGIANENEVTAKRTFLPALLYIVFMSSNPLLLTLSPSMVANLFILLSIQRMLSSFRKNVAFSNSFDAAFLLSLASLFYFPTIVLFFILIAGLVIFRSYNWREWFIAFIGTLLPYCFVITYCFYNDTLFDFWFNIKKYFVLHEKPIFDFSHFFYLMASIGISIVLLSFTKIPYSIRVASQKTKKNLLFIFWVLMFSIASLALAPEISSPYFSVLAIPLSIFATNYFLNIKKEWLGELLFLLFITSILINDFSKYF